jgi:hypothetical protein
MHVGRWRDCSSSEVQDSLMHENFIVRSLQCAYLAYSDCMYFSLRPDPPTPILTNARCMWLPLIQMLSISESVKASQIARSSMEPGEDWRLAGTACCQVARVRKQRNRESSSLDSRRLSGISSGSTGRWSVTCWRYPTGVILVNDSRANRSRSSEMQKS